MHLRSIATVRPLALVALVAGVAFAACSWTSAPDCSKACDFVVECPGLDRNFNLFCSSASAYCSQLEADCAACITSHSCDQLDAGACDFYPPATLADGGAAPPEAMCLAGSK